MEPTIKLYTAEEAKALKIPLTSNFITQYNKYTVKKDKEGNKYFGSCYVNGRYDVLEEICWVDQIADKNLAEKIKTAYNKFSKKPEIKTAYDLLVLMDQLGRDSERFGIEFEADNKFYGSIIINSWFNIDNIYNFDKVTFGNFSQKDGYISCYVLRKKDMSSDSVFFNNIKDAYKYLLQQMVTYEKLDIKIRRDFYRNDNFSHIDNLCSCSNFSKNTDCEPNRKYLESFIAKNKIDVDLYYKYSTYLTKTYPDGSIEKVPYTRVNKSEKGFLCEANQYIDHINKSLAGKWQPEIYRSKLTLDKNAKIEVVYDY